MDIENSAKMIVEVAKAQDDEIGDGTTTAVIICRKAAEAEGGGTLEQDVHPTVIVQGYRRLPRRRK